MGAVMSGFFRSETLPKSGLQTCGLPDMATFCNFHTGVDKSKKLTVLFKNGSKYVLV